MHVGHKDYVRFPFPFMLCEEVVFVIPRLAWTLLEWISLTPWDQTCLTEIHENNSGKIDYCIINMDLHAACDFSLQRCIDAISTLGSQVYTTNPTNSFKIASEVHGLEVIRD